MLVLHLYLAELMDIEIYSVQNAVGARYSAGGLEQSESIKGITKYAYMNVLHDRVVSVYATGDFSHFHAF